MSFEDRILNKKELKSKTKRKMNPSRRGHTLEAMFNRSIKRLHSLKLISHFYDKFRKLEVEKRDLLGDYWFIDNNSKFNLVELKVVNSSTRLPLDRIGEHQFNNLLTIEYLKHKGWLIIHFKGYRKKYGLFAISGTFLYKYTNSYSTLSTEIGVSDRNKIGSILFTDLVKLSEKKNKDVIKLDIIKEKNALGYRKLEYIRLEELL